MRTTVIIDNSLENRLRELEKAYARASKDKNAENFGAVDAEDWPECDGEGGDGDQGSFGVEIGPKTGSL